MLLLWTIKKDLKISVPLLVSSVCFLAFYQHFFHYFVVLQAQKQTSPSTSNKAPKCIATLFSSSTLPVVDVLLSFWSPNINLGALTIGEPWCVLLQLFLQTSRCWMPNTFQQLVTKYIGHMYWHLTLESVLLLTFTERKHVRCHTPATAPVTTAPRLL